MAKTKNRFTKVDNMIDVDSRRESLEMLKEAWSELPSDERSLFFVEFADKLIKIAENSDRRLN